MLGVKVRSKCPSPIPTLSSSALLERLRPAYWARRLQTAPSDAEVLHYFLAICTSLLRFLDIGFSQTTHYLHLLSAS